MSKLYKMAGVTDDVTTCSCCNRKNLKRTVVLENQTEENFGEFVFFGSMCAAKALGWGTATKAKIEKQALDALYTTVEDYISKLLDEAIANDLIRTIDGQYWLKETKLRWCDTGIKPSRQEVANEMIAKWPILSYRYNDMSVKDAAKLIF